MSMETVIARDRTQKYLSPFNPKRNPPSPSESTISPPPSLIHQDTEADTESLTPTPGKMRLDPQQPIVFISNGSEEELGCYLASYFLKSNCKVILALPKPSENEHHIINDLDCDKIHLNLRDSHSIDSVYEHIKAKYTKIDILVIPPTKDLIGPLINLNLNNLNNLLDFNLIGNLNLIQKFSKLLILQNSGIIAFITSGLGRWGTPWNEAFGLSMASLYSVIQTLKLELAPFNVSVMNFQINEIKSLVLNNNLRQLSVQNQYYPVKDYIYCSGVMSHSEIHHKLDNAASKVVQIIMNRSSGFHRFWHILFLPLYYFIYLLALAIGYVIPDLVPHLKYFTATNSVYPIYTSDYFVLEGWFKINLFSISKLLPIALKEWLVWDITGLGYINYPSSTQFENTATSTEEECKNYLEQSNYSRTPRSSFSSFK